MTEEKRANYHHAYYSLYISLIDSFYEYETINHPGILVTLKVLHELMTVHFNPIQDKDKGKEKVN
jgi:hypothetical protein